MGHVEEFLRALVTSEQLCPFGQLRIFLDEDIRCPEKYTALRSLYFIHNNSKNVQIWDLHGHKYLPLTGKEVYIGSIEHFGTKEKLKFPTEIFLESEGFMRTRWSIGHTIFDLVNIHLFHDASNFIAMEDVFY
ncbi:inositol polyphosphate-5-phosphatase A-like [Stegodyphus dumicola]|uniref:inositol polyphosphate-5-phosphatase A-like n=1 Tax=Stegodyphus dumicola TaxID=202533 RepID=UPI0015AFED3D|nr:inositol polyphosphate-5-phosphatase A-like [Stegodyphus dumicola]